MNGNWAGIQTGRQFESRNHDQNDFEADPSLDVINTIVSSNKFLSPTAKASIVCLARYFFDLRIH